MLIAENIRHSVELGVRTRENAERFFYRTQDPLIQNTLPSASSTVEEALAAYDAACRPDAASYGRSILYQGRHVGDIWCYCIDTHDTPNAMLSYCVFEKELWGHGIASAAAALFLEEIIPRYALRTIGAFTYADNAASIRVLERNGFTLRESFCEDGRESVYCQRG